MRRARLGVGRSAPRACAQRQGLWARWTVVWGGAIGAVRSSSPQRCRVVVAVGGLQPGRSTRSASRASAQHEGFPWAQGVSRGGRMPHDVVGRRTFTPLRWCWTVGRHLGRVTVARLSTTLGPWGLLAMWPGVLCVPSSALGVVAHRRRDSIVVVCAGCEGCVAHLCATPWVWLCQRDGSGGSACSLALVVVGGACPVVVLVRGGALPRGWWMSRGNNAGHFPR